MTLDAVARLILDEAAPLHGRVLVLDDVDGALAAASSGAGCDVRAWCDDVRDAAAIAPELTLTSDASGAGPWADPFIGEADVVLWRLPRSLSALEEYAQRLAAGLAASARVVAGGRVKHMTPTQNEVLARSFRQVHASLGRQKSRVLHASGPVAGALTWPRAHFLTEFGLDVWAHGATFNTNRLDAGTALLLRALAPTLAPGREGRALDLGCGSGIIATLLARAGWSTEASDVSAAAVASTRLAAAANGVAVDVAQRDGLVGVRPQSLDLIVTNPPFHRGAAKDSTPTLDAIAGAGDALKPGGEFWCVFNSHLPYLPALRAAIGPTRVIARDRHYTVTLSRRGQ